MRTARKTVLRVLPLALIGLAALTRVAVGLHAAPEATPAAPAATPPSTPKPVTYEAGEAQWLAAPRSVSLSQGVTFGQDDATLKTDAATALLDKEQHLLTAEALGPVHIFDPQDDLNGRHGTIDFTKHLAKLEDNVVLVVKPGKREAEADAASPRKQFKDPATLTCQGMTYDYRRKIGRVPGPLTVTQVVQTKDGPETRVLTADAGLYNGRAQTIQLVGDIRVTNSDGSKMIADTRPSGKPVVIGTKEGAEYIRVPFGTTGIFKLKPEKDDAADTASSPADDLTTVPTPPPSSQTATPPASPKPGGATPSLAPVTDAPTVSPSATSAQKAPPPATPPGTAKP